MRRDHRWLVISLFAVLSWLGWPSRLFAVCVDPPGDVTADGVTSAVDIQCAILAVLAAAEGSGSPMPECAQGDLHRVDASCDASVDVTDVLLAITYALGAPLGTAIDADQDGCPDACVPANCCLWTDYLLPFDPSFCVQFGGGPQPASVCEVICCLEFDYDTFLYTGEVMPFEDCPPAMIGNPPPPIPSCEPVCCKVGIDHYVVPAAGCPLQNGTVVGPADGCGDPVPLDGCCLLANGKLVEADLGTCTSLGGVAQTLEVCESMCCILVADAPYTYIAQTHVVSLQKCQDLAEAPWDYFVPKTTLPLVKSQCEPACCITNQPSAESYTMPAAACATLFGTTIAPLEVCTSGQVCCNYSQFSVVVSGPQCYSGRGAFYPVEQCVPVCCKVGDSPQLPSFPTEEATCLGLGGSAIGPASPCP